MRRSLTHVVVAAAAMSFSFPVLAQTKQGCPPGSWFCADVSVAPPVQVQKRAAPPPVEVDEPETPADPEPAPRPVRRKRAKAPEVVYQDAPEPPPQVIIVTPGYDSPPTYRRPVRPVPPPPERRARHHRRWRSEIGLNLRAEGVALGGRGAGASSTAGMGGVGLSLRYRPIPAFAFDLGVDVLAGHDFNGFQRVEVPVTLSGLIYLNPRSRVQFYLLGGAHISHAQVRADFPAPQLRLTDDGTQFGADYTYFGGQGGGGLEFRVSRRVALNLDVVGFVRKRIDDGRKPEFIDYDTGRTTNTSGGALIRGGLTFWW
jgi:hypothetical protein